MNVRLGWSGDIHGTWTKMDVEVDDSDLDLHFVEAGCSDVANLTYSPVEKFKLMYQIAETFVQLHKMSRFPEFFGRPEDKAQLQSLIESRDKLTKEIVARCE